MLMPTFTHTAAPYDSLRRPSSGRAPSAGLHANDNFVTQQVTGFYGGQVYGNLGAFIQVTGDPVGGAVNLDSSDVRYVDSFKLFGKDAYLGRDRQQFADRAGRVEHDAGIAAGRRSPRRSRQLSRRPARASKAAGVCRRSSAPARTCSGTTCFTPS